MAQQTTPHTETQQDKDPAQTDLEPGILEQEVGTDADPDAGIYANNAGAQTGTNRGPEFFPATLEFHNTEEQDVAHQGSLTTRTPRGDTQGITNQTSSAESERQEKVVRDRPDAQAGVNHSK